MIFFCLVFANTSNLRLLRHCLKVFEKVKAFNIHVSGHARLVEIFATVLLSVLMADLQHQSTTFHYLVRFPIFFFLPFFLPLFGNATEVNRDHTSSCNQQCPKNESTVRTAFLPCNPTGTQQSLVMLHYCESHNSWP